MQNRRKNEGELVLYENSSKSLASQYAVTIKM